MRTRYLNRRTHNLRFLLVVRCSCTISTVSACLLVFLGLVFRLGRRCLGRWDIFVRCILVRFLSALELLLEQVRV